MRERMSEAGRNPRLECVLALARAVLSEVARAAAAAVAEVEHGGGGRGAGAMAADGRGCGVTRGTVAGAAVLALACAAAPVSAAEAHKTLDERWRERPVLTNPDEGRYVPMLTNPIFNETPHITTELRPFYLYNQVPSDFLTNGGHINVVGVQSRLALTDRIGLYVSKAGYAWATFDENLPDADGALNVSFGAKYAIVSSPKRSTFLTGGLKYEAPSGDIESGVVELQGGGDGFFNPYLTFGAQAGLRTGFQSSAGFNVAVDGDHDSSAFHYALHVDYELFENLFAIVEGNLLTTVSEGDRTPSEVLGSFEGYDLYNFGNDDSGTVITTGVGARYRLGEHFLLGAGVEVPMPGRQDLVGVRMLFDIVAHL
jgi:hypothetical protein